MSVDLTGKTVYLAGPMRGKPGRNLAAHMDAADALVRLRAAEVTGGAVRKVWGLYRQCPDAGLTCATHRQMLAHIDARGWCYQEETTAEYMERDLPLVCRADALVVLPDWQASEGTRIEVSVALLLGKPIYCWPDLTLVRGGAILSRTDEEAILLAVAADVLLAVLRAARASGQHDEFDWRRERIERHEACALTHLTAHLRQRQNEADGDEEDHLPLVLARVVFALAKREAANREEHPVRRAVSEFCSRRRFVCLGCPLYGPCGHAREDCPEDLPRCAELLGIDGTRQQSVAALKGKYADVPTSADEFLARKHGEERR